MFKKAKKISAAVLSAVMILTAVATPLGDNLPAVRDSVSVTAGADSYQCPIYPMKVVNITQGENGTYSHAGTLAIDIVGADNLFAPFDGTIKKIYTENNSVWLESDNPVIYADGTVDYMTVKFAHDNDISDLYVGKKIKKGEIFYQPGTKGYATGSHVHLTCGRGKTSDNGYVKNSLGNWKIKNEIHVYDALFLSESTVIKNGRGYNWRYETINLKSTPSDIGSDFESVIRCTSTGKVLSAGSDNNVTAVSYNGSNNQLWKFYKNSDNYYEIVNVGTGKRLDVSNAGIDNGTNIQVWEDNDSSAQRWGVYGSQGSYLLKPKYSTSGVLDSGGGNNNVHLWAYANNIAAQKFTIEKMPSTWFSDVTAKNIKTNDARIALYANKPASAKATKYSIEVWQTNNSSNKKTYSFTPSGNYPNEGVESKQIYFDMIGEVGFTLSPATQYSYKITQDFTYLGASMSRTSGTYSFTTLASSSHTHSYGSWYTTASATCTSGGTEERKCSCGATETRSTSALGHNYGYWETDRNATCTEDGTEARICSRCGGAEYRNVSALGHDFSSEWTIDIQPTCTTEGSKSRHCTRCDEKTDVTTIEKTYHSYNTDIIHPTFEDGGYMIHTCSVCGDSYIDNYTEKLSLEPVSGVKLGGRAADALRINWNENTLANGYIIEMYKSGKWTRIAKIKDSSTTTYRATGLKAGTAYKFRVKAYVLYGDTPLYSDYNATVAARTNPSVIKGAKLGGRAADALRINWTKNASADGYIVEMYQGNKWVRVGKITNNSTTTFRKAGLKASSVYKFRVRAYKMSGKTALYGNYSATVTARTNPSIVKGITAAVKTSKAIALRWDKNTSAQGYIVEMYKGGKWVRAAKITDNGKTLFKKTGLKANTVYRFRVKAYHMSGKTALYGNCGNISVRTAK